MLACTSVFFHSYWRPLVFLVLDSLSVSGALRYKKERRNALADGPTHYAMELGWPKPVRVFEKEGLEGRFSVTVLTMGESIGQRPQSVGILL